MNARSVCQICALVLLAANVALAAPVTYYVKNAPGDVGDDGESGLSDTKAWATIGKVNTEFTNGKFKAGDTILLKCGSQWAERLVVGQSGDTTDGDITIGAYGSGEKPILGYDRKYTGWTATAGRTNVYEVSLTPEAHIVNGYLLPTELGAAAGYFRIYALKSSVPAVEATEGTFYWASSTLYVHPWDNTDLSTSTTKEMYGNTEGWQATAAIDVTDEEYVTIQDVHVVCSNAGIFGSPADQITIKDCRMSGSRQGTGFEDESSVESSNIVIHDNDARYNSNGFKFGGSGNLTVYDNTIAHTWIKLGHGEDREAIAFNNCHDVEVYGNHVFESDFGVVGFSPVGVPDSNFDIHHNFFEHPVARAIAFGGPGKFGGDLYVYHNIVWVSPDEFTDPGNGDSVTSRGIVLLSETQLSSKPYQVWNNTLRVRQGVAMDSGNPINLKLYNNIFYDCQYHIVDDAAAITADVHERNDNIFNVVSESPIHRIYWGGGTAHSTMSAYQTAADPQEDDSIEDDPEFVDEPDNLRVAFSGPANDSGLNPPGDVPFDPDTALDFYGQAIDGQASIGAAEPPTAP